MVDFRKSLLVLLVLVFVASFASAQVTTPLSCSASAGVPPPVRAEGLAEEIGQITITCIGGQPTAAGSPIATVNVQLLLNTQITSKLLGSSTDKTEALLLIDEPKPIGMARPSGEPVGFDSNPANGLYDVNEAGTQLVATTAPNTQIPNGLGTGQYRGGVDGRPNVFVGQYFPAQPNSITWLNIPFDPPGTLNNRVLRIVNVRAKIKGGPALSSSALIPSSVYAYLSISGTGSLALSQPSLTVAYVQKSLSVSVSHIPTMQLCWANPNYSDYFNVTFTELFGTAFRHKDSTWKTAQLDKSQAVPGTIYNTESMFYNLDFVNTIANTAGQATQGTRLYAKFTNVPAGVTLSVPTVISNGTTLPYDKAVLVATGVDGSTTSSTGSVGLDSNRTGVAVYEITQTADVAGYSNPGAISSLTAAVTATYTQTAEVDKTAYVAGEYSPLSTKDTPQYPVDSTTAVPRFVDDLTFLPTFKITTCKTNLLFPYVAYDPGSNWDTGLAIANTSADIFGTVTQQGTCDINYFNGGNAPGKQTTGVVVPGAVATMTLGLGGVSSNATSVTKLASGFVGYIIASCNFQYAHAYAYLSNGITAEGYLALVMDQNMFGYGTTRTKAMSETLIH